MSLKRSAEFLDTVAVQWTRQRKCGTCHTNYPYLAARPALSVGRASVYVRLATPVAKAVQRGLVDEAKSRERGQLPKAS